MPLFRRKSEKLPKTSSIVLYSQGRSQTPPCNSGKGSDKNFEILDEIQQPFLTFAEVTYDPSVPVRGRSRLSKTLEDVLHDNGALAYFIQFMEAKKAKHLVKFWLEAESFHVSVTSRLRVFSNSGEHFHTAVTIPSSVVKSDCESNSSSSGTVFHSSSQELRQGASKVMPSVSCQIPRNDSLDSASVSSQSCTSETSLRPDGISQSSKTLNAGGEENLAQSETVGNYISDKTTKEVVKESCDVVDGVPASGNASQNITVCSGSLSSVSADSQAEPAEEALTLNMSFQTEKPKYSFVRLHTSIEQDAKSIYSKYIAHGAQFPIGISEELYQQITDSIFRSDNKVDPECFFPAQEFVVKKMDEEYFPLFLRSTFHCKHQIDVLTSGSVFLADVLYNDSALFYFMEFMEQENVRHLVDFLLMADNFRKHLSLQESYDPDQAQNDAMVIYDKYFSLQATNSLGFSDSIRYEVEHNICRDGGPLSDCFLKPVMILSQYIEKTYLLQFLNSQLYFKYISECIITIQSGGMESETHQKNSGSESGSEHSLPISSVNTLLAMDGKQPGASSKMLKNIEDQDMRIDTGRFKPDSLWQRPLAGKLQIAGVDNLGRVITEFEPEPDRRKESRISKAVKKLVNREDDKNQEDMAWKVAEMIVKDICSITMPESVEKSEKNGPS